MTEQELREWAEAHVVAGSEVASAVLNLFRKLDSHILPRAVLDRAVEEMRKEDVLLAESLVKMKEMPVVSHWDNMTAAAKIQNHWGELPKVQDNRPFDGSTGTPEHGRAGFKNPPPPGNSQ